MKTLKFLALSLASLITSQAFAVDFNSIIVENTKAQKELHEIRHFVLPVTSWPDFPGIFSAVIPGRSQSERARNPGQISAHASGFRVRALRHAPE